MIDCFYGTNVKKNVERGSVKIGGFLYGCSNGSDF